MFSLFFDGVANLLLVFIMLFNQVGMSRKTFMKVFAKFLVSLKREPFLSGGYELGLSWDRLFEFLGLDIPTWLKRIIQK